MVKRRFTLPGRLDPVVCRIPAVVGGVRPIALGELEVPVPTMPCIFRRLPHRRRHVPEPRHSCPLATRPVPRERASLVLLHVAACGQVVVCRTLIVVGKALVALAPPLVEIRPVLIPLPHFVPQVARGLVATAGAHITILRTAITQGCIAIAVLRRGLAVSTPGAGLGALLPTRPARLITLIHPHDLRRDTPRVEDRTPARRQ